MATKKTSATAASKKDAPAKKATAAKGAPTLKLDGALPKLTLNMPLDAKKIKAIQKCLDKGTLNITVSKLDLAAGRLAGAWLYD